ncbi:MAG TPA: MBL fold metallo-hydrolase [Polyangiaceae bacterium]|nr:MBL fold metallo-hydrolase [Polyangiaceae bacterium]
MKLRQLFDPETSTYTYLLVDERTGRAALVDPVREQLDRDLALVRELGVDLAYVLETHVHADHVTAAGPIADRTGAETVASAKGAACAMRHVRQGDVLPLGDLEIRVLETPGHTQDSLSFFVPGHVFTGDALFVRGTGRTDFQNGDAGALYDSITERLFTLPDETIVWPGHDYRGHTASTIGEEKRYNPRIAGRSRDEFIALMATLDLPPPKRIAVAVPRNLECGRDAHAP